MTYSNYKLQIMRCDNCGWENPDQNLKCEKCNAPLSGASRQPFSSSPNEGSSQNLNKTISEGIVFPEPQAMGNNVCPYCNYPMRPGSQVCPNCGNSVTQREPHTCQSQNIVRPDRVHVHQQPNNGQGTVNPWIDVAKPAQCTLTPVAHNSETEVPAPQVFKGENHKLNRQNLDVENLTITSAEQALLTYENGQWYIEDKSSQRTTFIHVGEKTALKEGDIILMGNRMFVFKSE